MDYEDPTLFEGIRFYLAGFNPLSHEQVKSKIVSCGGVYVANYSPDCTHVIVYNLLRDDPICVAARRDGKALVTDLWITHSFEAGMLADTSSVMYRPVKELNGVPGAKELVISLTGFQGGRRSDIMTMVGMMGAEFAKNLAPGRVTHLICYKFEGAKYVVGRKFSTIKIVNHQWLEDCLKAWKILPEENYSKSSYELEMMEAMAPDSEEETEDTTPRLNVQRVMNGIPGVQNETGNALDNSAIASRVLTSSAQTPPYNVRNDEAMLSFEPKQASEFEIHHRIDKHTPVRQNNDGQNVTKMPLESNRSLQDGGELVNPSGPSSKRSADSLFDYSGPLIPTKTAKRFNVSAENPGSSNRKTAENLESDDVQFSTLEADKVKVTSAGFGGSNSKGISEIHSVNYSPSSMRRSNISLQSAARLITPEGKLQHLAENVTNVDGCDVVPDKKLSASEEVPNVEGQCALPQSKQLSGHSDVSRVSPKLQKLKATASKRIDASEPPASVSSPLKKNKNSSFGISSHTGTGIVRASEDKSLAFEKLQVGKSDNVNPQTSLTCENAILCATPGVINKKAKPQKSPEFATFSPELKELEALKSGNSNLISDDQTGGSTSKTLRKKMVARKTLGSRPKVSKKTADPKKGSLGGNFSNDDAALCLTSQIGGKDDANPSVTDKITTAHAVGGTNALESKPLQDFAVDIDDFAAPFNDGDEALPEFALHQNKATDSLHVTKARARAASSMLHCETDEAEMTKSPSADTYNQGMEHAKQNLTQKKEISRRSNGKTLISAPKEVLQDADDIVGGNVNEKKDCVKRQTVSAAGKKRRGGKLMKNTVQAQNEPVASGDPGACSGVEVSENLALKKRRGMLLLSKSDISVEAQKNNESAHDKHGQHDDSDKQPEKLSGTSNSTEVRMENKNEHDTSADKGQNKKKCVKHAGKKRHGTQLENLISAGKENLPSLGGKLRKMSGISNNSVVGDNQVNIKGKKIVGKKRCGTLALNKTDGSVEAENENETVIHDDKVISNNESLKSNLTVKESNVISSDPSINQSSLTAAKNEPACFIVSGHRLQRKEFQQLIKRLKGKHCRDSHQWSYQATHFIVPDPIRRTEKFFAAAASGRWILKTDYLTECSQAGKFLPEEPYEWHKNGLTEDGAINLEAPRKWRLLREKTGHGAFYGMRIVVYGECIAPPLDTLKRVVKAGDGTILATSPPYTRFLNSGVDFAIVSPGMPRVDIWVQEFLRHEIPCISADYLVEYVCKPGYPLDRHVHYSTHEWAAKSFHRLSTLSTESAADADSPENQVSDDLDLACQVCGCSDRAEVMLVCGDESGSTGCGVGTHIDCCDPPFDNVPDEDWFCPNCMLSKTNDLNNSV
ncbi:hypothetical protein RND81_02G004400 [Saponaria officinalis]|uniref:BRCT domain-containing protein n=1 Tax=Saponaria officinalis TaxID=3572 RepID=A0AAW1MR20_SAPOF